jgi:hypothetical protein
MNRTYSPTLQPLLQSLLLTLADIDFAYESNLETVRNSISDEVLKREVIGKLQQQHQERRTPYVRQLAALQERIRALAA